MQEVSRKNPTKFLLKKRHTILIQFFHPLWEKHLHHIWHSKFYDTFSFLSASKNYLGEDGQYGT